MSRFSHKANELLFEGHAVASFDLPIFEVLDCDSCALVLLDVLDSKRHMNENVFGVDIDGNVLWQTPRRAAESNYDPYIGTALREGRVAIYSWNGDEVIIDPRTGRILSTQWLK